MYLFEGKKRVMRLNGITVVQVLIGMIYRVFQKTYVTFESYICDILRVIHFCFGRCMNVFITYKVRINNLIAMVSYTFSSVVDTLNKSYAFEENGVIFKVNERKFGKMKYERHRLVNGKWVLSRGMKE